MGAVGAGWGWGEGRKGGVAGLGPTEQEGARGPGSLQTADGHTRVNARRRTRKRGMIARQLRLANNNNRTRDRDEHTKKHDANRHRGKRWPDHMRSPATGAVDPTDGVMLGNVISLDHLRRQRRRQTRHVAQQGGEARTTL